MCEQHIEHLLDKLDEVNHQLLREQKENAKLQKDNQSLIKAIKKYKKQEQINQKRRKK